MKNKKNAILAQKEKLPLIVQLAEIKEIDPDKVVSNKFIRNDTVNSDHFKIFVFYKPISKVINFLDE